MVSVLMRASADKARAEEVAEVFRRIPAGVTGGAAGSVCLAAIVVRFNLASPTKGTLFALIVCACAVIHILLATAYHRDPNRNLRWRAWGAAISAVSFMEGLSWGLAPMVLPSENYIAELTCLLTTLGITAGASAVFGAYFPSFLSLFVPATLPYVLQNLASADDMRRATILLMLIYMGAMAVVGLSTSRSFKRLVESRLQAETLRREAEKANRDKSSFLAAASDDLRQPVHALGLFVGALRGMSMSPEAISVVERIEASTKALDSLYLASMPEL